MLPAHSEVTDGMFCDPASLTVAHGEVWDGLFCDVDVIIPTPPRGGGGSGPGVSAPGFNQAPSVKKDRELYIDQALNEDEELIILLKAFAEVIQWH